MLRLPAPPCLTLNFRTHCPAPCRSIETDLGWKIKWDVFQHVPARTSSGHHEEDVTNRSLISRLGDALSSLSMLLPHFGPHHHRAEPEAAQQPEAQQQAQQAQQQAQQQPQQAEHAEKEPSPKPVHHPHHAHRPHLEAITEGGTCCAALCCALLCCAVLCADLASRATHAVA